MVILSAIAIISIRNDDIVGMTAEGTLEYAYQQEEEKIIDALYQALLQSFIKESQNFNYADMPAYVAEILEETGQFTCEEVKDGVEDGFCKYNITPTGKGFYFVLCMNTSNGAYDLTLGE